MFTVIQNTYRPSNNDCFFFTIRNQRSQLEAFILTASHVLIYIITNDILFFVLALLKTTDSSYSGGGNGIITSKNTFDAP